jgi:class 3 adenylate cyclase
VKFAGDAVIFYWTLDVKRGDKEDDDDFDDDDISPEENIERGECVLRACECCLQLLTELGEYKIDLPDIDIKVLRIHLGIGAGALYDVHVGGGPGRWEHLIAGDAINQLGIVLDLAKPGKAHFSSGSKPVSLLSSLKRSTGLVSPGSAMVSGGD